MNFMINTVTGENAITTEDGQTVYDRMTPELRANHSVVLDFSGVTVIASPFFNAAIGQLLKDFSADDLNRLLIVRNLVPAGVDVLVRVIENSRKYYASPDYQEAQKKVLRELAEED